MVFVGDGILHRRHDHQVKHGADQGQVTSKVVVSNVGRFWGGLDVRDQKRVVLKGNDACHGQDADSSTDDALIQSEERSSENQSEPNSLDNVLKQLLESEASIDTIFGIGKSQASRGMQERHVEVFARGGHIVAKENDQESECNPAEMVVPR